MTNPPSPRSTATTSAARLEPVSALFAVNLRRQDARTNPRGTSPGAKLNFKSEAARNRQDTKRREDQCAKNKPVVFGAYCFAFVRLCSCIRHRWAGFAGICSGASCNSSITFRHHCDVALVEMFLISSIASGTAAPSLDANQTASESSGVVATPGRLRSGSWVMYAAYAVSRALSGSLRPPFSQYASQAAAHAGSFITGMISVFSSGPPNSGSSDGVLGHSSIDAAFASWGRIQNSHPRRSCSAWP